MAEDKNTSQINMRIPGMKGGPRNRGAAVEKPVNGKETFMRLMQYFAKEIPVIIALFIAVVVMVVCSVYAPKLQSQAIDYISLRKLSRFYAKNTFYVLISHLCNLFFTDTISSCQGLHDLYYKGTFITLTTIWNRSHIRTICL